MTIAAEKINENAFYDIYELVEKYNWLKHFVHPLVELWNICDERGQQDLIKNLLMRFTFVDSYQLETISREIFEKLTEWNLNPINTYIAAIANENEVDGSTAGLQFIKNKFPSIKGWTDRNFLASIIQAANKTNTNDNIILFDDFIGSGKTMLRKIDYILENFEKRKIRANSIKIIAYAGMEFGIKAIQEKHNIEIFTPIPLKKGLTDFESAEALIIKKNLMKSLEAKLGKKFKKLKIEDHSLGYKNSETLFQIYGYNCPNNLFPIFWWPTLADETERRTLFQRIR